LVNIGYYTTSSEIKKVAMGWECRFVRMIRNAYRILVRKRLLGRSRR